MAGRFTGQSIERREDDRLLRGARLLLADGQLDRVGELADSLRACDPGPLRDLVLGSYAYETGDAESALALLSNAASHDDADASIRADAHIRLSSIYVLRGDPWQQAGTVQSRRLPSSAASGIEPIAQWLDCHLARDASGRLLTTFNFGSYARWRLPRLSESIDGRTIFPDSAAAAEAYFLPVRRTLPLPPWRSADLAIVPLSYPVASVLDTASAWRRVATVADQNGRASIIGLWVNREWWSRAGTTDLPSRSLTLFHRATSAGGCDWIGPVK